jgi:ABC-type antimicrobial peptide transport system permease subunit
MLSFWTAQHRRELGVRLALGATREHVAALVVKRGLAVVGAGLAVGLGLTLATGKYLESLLFGVPPADLPTLLTAASVLVAIAVLVCAVPGRQAARVNPIEILRAE